MKKAIYHVIGVMSGTSLDGVDLCYVNFTKDEQWGFEILKSKTVEYSEKWQERLKTAIKSNADILAQLDFDYSVFLAHTIKDFIEDFQIQNIDAICSHGHTVFHEPQKGITKQIGNLDVLAKIIGRKIVCDFRVDDVALGGEGAPLVPIGDRLLFSEYDFCVNLGGFANISYEFNKQRIAYDICPVNIVMNRYAAILDLPYDDSGKIAKSGKINEQLLNTLNSLGFYQQKPPKSLGLEWVDNYIFPEIEKLNFKTDDILRTFVEHVSVQIANNVRENSKVLFTGGGTYNTFLLDRIKAQKKMKLIVPDKELIEYKEALIFGFLGVLKLRNEPNCLSSVTGASKDHSSGKIFQ